jgi:hypothetical protein
MEKSTFAVFLALILCSSLYAQQQQGLVFSGVFESSVSTRYSDSLVYGLEEYANIRMQRHIGDKATFFGAVNLVASSGVFVQNYEPTEDKNYIALIELERLYFRLNGESIKFDGGLMRLPLGYSQIWGSSDFLNPKNPLLPDARPRAVLGGGLFWYPTDSFKLLEFAVAPRDPFSQDGGITGIAADKHWDKASLQMLYSYEFPAPDAEGFHRAGTSFKADLELSFVFDMLLKLRN